MRVFAALAAIALAGAAVAQDTDAAPRRIDIVPPYNDIQLELDEHLASGDYDPQVDAKLSVDLADALAREGDYAKAKDALQDALRRNRKNGDDPLVSAFLHDTLANVEVRQGALTEQRKNRLATYNGLRDEYGDDHEIVGLAKLRLANAVLDESPEHPTRVSIGDSLIVRHMWPDKARDMLEEVEASAAAVHGETHPLTHLARLNRINLEIREHRFDEAQALLGELVDQATHDPAVDPAIAFRAHITDAKLRHALGDDAGSERAMERLLAMKLDAPDPILIFDFNPQDVIAEQARHANKSDIRFNDSAGNRATSRLAGSWADVGFCVTDEGRVANVELANHHGQTSWHGALLREVAGRRYYPRTNEGAFENCAYQLQRFTIESEQVETTGSRLHRKSSNTYLLVSDLHDERGIASPLFNPG